MATPLRLVPLVEPFLAPIAEGALLFAQAHGTAPERVDVLAGLCLRETHAGHAPGYRPLGDPDGTGDWSVRTGSWCKRVGVKVFPDTDAARDDLRERGWTIPKHKDEEGRLVVVPGPYAIPLDGRGWGRGIGQIDVLGDQRDLIAPAPWPVPRQAAAWCSQLHLGRGQLVEVGISPEHALFGRAVLSRYNASLDRVRAGLEAGDPDIGTTPSFGEKRGDYGRDVEALAAAVRARWPDTAIQLPGRTA